MILLKVVAIVSLLQFINCDEVNELSDEFIDQVNQLAETWQVCF